MSKKNINVPGVLAFEKKIVPSDGYMYGCTWEDRSTISPLNINEKSVRGTISNRLKPVLKNDPLKLNKAVQNPNLQIVDACALEPDHDTLKLNFTLKILGGIAKPSACGDTEFQHSYARQVASYIEEHGFRELARRYASNIANARFLWRNRVGAEEIAVTVSNRTKGMKESWQFDATQYAPRLMPLEEGKIDELTDRIASALASADDYLLLDIVVFAKLGKSQDVYPSQELVHDKGKGDKRKVLYQVNGIAALHSQKIGNALRSIDTWYPEYIDPERGVGPIAVEPYGSVTTMGQAFRNPRSKQDFYSLFDRWSCGEALENINDLHFVMAVLVRGGIFGQSSKEQ